MSALREGEIDPDSFAEPEAPVEGVEAEESEEQYTEAEQRAMEKGWSPDRAAWEADPKNEGKRWRDAETFLEFGELFDKISRLNQQTRKLSEGFQAERQRAYEKGLENARAEFKSAVEAGDGEAAEQARQDISRLEAEQQAAAETYPPEVEAFRERNPQILADPVMYQWADTLAQQRINAGASLEDALAFVETEARARFPEAFGVRKRPTAPAVEAPRRSPKGKARMPSFSELPESEQQAIRNMEGIDPKFDRNAFIKQLVENGEI